MHKSTQKLITSIVMELETVSEERDKLLFEVKQLRKRADEYLYNQKFVDEQQNQINYLTTRLNTNAFSISTS